MSKTVLTGDEAKAEVKKPARFDSIEYRSGFLDDEKCIGLYIHGVPIVFLEKDQVEVIADFLMQELVDWDVPEGQMSYETVIVE